MKCVACHLLPYIYFCFLCISERQRKFYVFVSVMMKGFTLVSFDAYKECTYILDNCVLIPLGKLTWYKKSINMKGKLLWHHKKVLI